MQEILIEALLGTGIAWLAGAASAGPAYGLKNLVGGGFRTGPSHITRISIGPLPGHHGDLRGEKRERLFGILMRLPKSFHLSQSCNSLCSCSLHPQRTGAEVKGAAALWGLQLRVMDAVEEEAGSASRLPTSVAMKKIMR